MKLVEAIKKNNQEQASRLLNLARHFKNKVIYQLDRRYNGNVLCWAVAYGYVYFIYLLMSFRTSWITVRMIL